LKAGSGYALEWKDGSGSALKSLKALEAQNGAEEGRVCSQKMEAQNGIVRGSMDQWLLIGITLKKSSIRIRISNFMEFGLRVRNGRRVAAMAECATDRFTFNSIYLINVVIAKI
jgi:hypothetical protein